MSIAKNSVIEAQDILDYLETKEQEEYASATDPSIYGSGVWLETYFWIRSDPSEYKYSDWAAGSYSAGDKVYYDGSVWRALQTTTSDPPAENSYWTEVWENETAGVEKVWTSTPDEHTAFTNIVSGSTVINYEDYDEHSTTTTLFSFVSYSGASTYATGNVVYSSTYDSYYVSLTDGNIGNALTDTDYWALLIKNRTRGVWNNIYLDRRAGTGVSYHEFTISRVIWDSLSNEVLIPVYKAAVADDGDCWGILEPGYYYIEAIAKKNSGRNNAKTTLYLKRWATDPEEDIRIRVMESDFSALATYGANLVTVALAQSGRLSSENYLGGDYGG